MLSRTDVGTPDVHIKVLENLFWRLELMLEYLKCTLNSWNHFNDVWNRCWNTRSTHLSARTSPTLNITDVRGSEVTINLLDVLL